MRLNRRRELAGRIGRWVVQEQVGQEEEMRGSRLLGLLRWV